MCKANIWKFGWRENTWLDAWFEKENDAGKRKTSRICGWRATPLNRNGQKTLLFHSGIKNNASNEATEHNFLKAGKIRLTGGHTKYFSCECNDWAKKFTPAEFVWGTIEKYLEHTVLCWDAKQSTVGTNRKWLKTVCNICRSTDHSSVEFENFEPKSARISLDCSLVVQTGIIRICKVLSICLIFTTSCWILGTLDPRRRNVKQFRESVCQNTFPPILEGLSSNPFVPCQANQSN